MTDSMTHHIKRGLRMVVVAGVVAVALWLRLGGLSHGLSDGIVYHPDTPKQAFATQRFLQQQYFIHIGNPDYDGYPYFSSLLADLAFRSVIPVINGVLSHMGLSSTITPDTDSILWVMRLINALMSVGIIGFVYSLGTVAFNRRVGCVAALFATLSPLSIVACHYGMSDTPVAFFSILSVIFCVRIQRFGHYRDYAAAACFAAFSFASKYHGGMVIFPCILAHVLWCGRLPCLFKRESLKRVGVALLFAVVGLILSTPALWVAPEQAVKDLLDFFGRISTFGMAFLADMNVFQRMIFAIVHNSDSFLMALSPLAVLLLVVGIFFLPKSRRESWVLAALPMGYVFVGLTSKPLSDPQYHSMTTHVVFVLLAAFIVQVGWGISRLKKLTVPLAIVSVFIVSGMLLRVSLEQVFFFKATDTRQLATTWNVENVPEDFSVVGARYTLLSGSGESGDMGRADYRMGKVDPADRSALAYAFDMGDSQFTLFRNPPVVVTIHEGPWIRAGWTLPVFNLMPSGSDANVVLADQPNFSRSPLVRLVQKEHVDSFCIANPTRLTNLWVVVRCGRLPSRVELEIGGERRSVLLAPSESKGIPFSDVKPTRVSHGGSYIYQTKIRTSLEQVRVQICTSPERYAAALFNAGCKEQAALAFEKANLSNPTLSRMGGDTSSVVHVGLDFDNTISSFGLAAEYIESLPGAEFLAEDLAEDAYQQHAPVLALPVMMLETGAYAVKFQLHPGITEIVDTPFQVIDNRTRKPLPLRELSVDGDTRKGLHEFIFEVPAHVTACKIICDSRIRREHILAVSCRVDVHDTLSMLFEPSREGASPILPLYHDANAVFDHGITLKGWALGAGSCIAVGQSDVLHLYWDVDNPDAFVHEVGVWVHVLDAFGKIAFQADRSFSVDLAIRPDDGVIRGLGADFTVPNELSPGDYSIRAGLYIPMQSRRIPIRSSSLPHEKDGVSLGALRVTRAH